MSGRCKGLEARATSVCLRSSKSRVNWGSCSETRSGRKGGPQVVGGLRTCDGWERRRRDFFHVSSFYSILSFFKSQKIFIPPSFYFMQKSINSPLFCMCEIETVINVEHLLSSPVLYITLNFNSFLSL